MTFFAQGFSSAPPPPASSSAAAALHDPEAPKSTTSSPLLPTANKKPDTFVMTRVSGPEPGYRATPIIFVELGRCVGLCFCLLSMFASYLCLLKFVNPSI